MTREFERKIQRYIDDISKNDFTPDTVKNLCSTLRNYSYGNKIFVEISHAIVHADFIDRGLFQTMLLDVYLRGCQPKPIDFKRISVEDKRLLDQLVVHQRIQDVKKFKVEIGRVKSFIKNRLKQFGDYYRLENPSNLNTSDKSILSFINHCFGQIRAVTSNEFLDELIDAIKANGFKIDEVMFRERSDQITLAILYSLNGVQFQVAEGVLVTGRVTAVKSVHPTLRLLASVPFRRELVPEKGNLLAYFDSFESHGLSLDLFVTDLAESRYLDDSASSTKVADTRFSDNDFIVKDGMLKSLPYEGVGRLEISWDNLLKKLEGGELD